MSDQQRLRDALQAAVPDPPTEPWQGSDARVHARSLRRRRVGTGIAAVLVIATAIPIVRSLSTPDRTETLDITTHGTGETACRQLEHHGLGFLADSRVITTAVAARWFDQLSGIGGRDVTVCVLSAKVNRLTVVALHDHRPTVVSRGDYQQTSEVMERLGALQAREPSSLTQSAFACPRPLDNDNVALPGSATLPRGATSARICPGGGYYPSQVMTSASGADNLVRRINAQPLVYQRGSSCGGGGNRSYTLVLDYPAGTRVVQGDVCGWIGVGPIQRQDAYPTIGDTFLAMLADQELAKGITPPLPCPAGRSSSPRGKAT